MSSPTDFLSREQCLALYHRLDALAPGGRNFTNITSAASNTVEWARSRMRTASRERRNDLSVTRFAAGGYGSGSTTRLDDDGLRELLHDIAVQAALVLQSTDVLEWYPWSRPNQPILQPTLWSDATYAYDAAASARVAQETILPAATAGLLSAGSLQMRASGTAYLDQWLARYYPQTEVEYSVTVRDVRGTASGWAGVNHFALDRIDPAALAARALEKCRRSANPVAIEPGRYTALLESQAMADLLWPLMVGRPGLGRAAAEDGSGPFAGPRGHSKIGERVLDRRLSLSSDPMDPDGPFIPFDASGTPYRAVTWIDRGILRELAYDEMYARGALRREQALPNPGSYRLAPAPEVAPASVDDMIANTRRGILVTRFHDVMPVDTDSYLSRGYTRDGLWLIEQGKITKSLKNMSIMESPLFILNNVEAVGAPQRVFQRGYSCLAPAVLVRDFNFVALADAV